MTAVNNLLVELLVEELPPKSLKNLGISFSEIMVNSLKAQQLVNANAQFRSFASPRRLAVWIQDVKAQAADQAVSKKIMPVKVALDEQGNATPALLKKLESMGLDSSVVSSLKRVPDGKMDALFYDATEAGITLSEGLQRALDETLTKLPIAKVMSYQLADGWHSVNFVRPAHGLVALFGEAIVPISALGLNAGRHSSGHRFEANSQQIEFADADSYADTLRKQGAVVASFTERRSEIEAQLAAAASKVNLRVIEDDALLDEVTALVERPNVLMGRFEAEFLEVPQECLILTMKANQKYFPLLDADGKLSNAFLLVSNISPADASLVIGGNERVVRPRLADAKFFFDQDRKKSLATRAAGLDKVVYHNKLGTQGERVLRVQTIARQIAERLGGIALANDSYLAAGLAKADLLTDMVGEFPELQGIMGRYYALHDGLSADIAFAIEDHYKPRYAGDELPRNDIGLALALADKMETLVGLFGIGQTPTGDKDPFALRRHALGVVRMMIERKLSLTLSEIIEIAIAGFPTTLISNPKSELQSFMLDRLGSILKESGASSNEVEAVLSQTPELLYQAPQKLEAVRAFSKLPEAAALAAANKRVSNILKKSETGQSLEIRADLLQEAAEHALFQALAQIGPQAELTASQSNYTHALQLLAALRQPVDAFFDSVMVNAEDAALRQNRLALLASLQAAMNRVADISRLAV